MLLKQSAHGIVGEMDLFRLITTMVTITAGTVFLMWIGELISEKNIGNGISLLIFAGIVSALPGKVQQMLVTFDSSQLAQMILFAAVAIATIVGVVFVTEGQRNIPVSTPTSARQSCFWRANNAFAFAREYGRRNSDYICISIICFLQWWLILCARNPVVADAAHDHHFI